MIGRILKKVDKKCINEIELPLKKQIKEYDIINSTNPTKDFLDVKQYIINYYNLCPDMVFKDTTQKKYFKNIYNSMLCHSMWEYHLMKIIIVKDGKQK